MDGYGPNWGNAGLYVQLSIQIDWVYKSCLGGMWVEFGGLVDNILLKGIKSRKEIEEKQEGQKQ